MGGSHDSYRGIGDYRVAQARVRYTQPYHSRSCVHAHQWSVVVLDRPNNQGKINYGTYTKRKV